jgi:uncharacterized membrane protein YwzB
MSPSLIIAHQIAHVVLLKFPAHGVASLFGQQARDLVLMDSDLMMVVHHVVTMFLSAYIWWGMQAYASTWPEMVALNAASVAALEAGSLGVCVWTLFESNRAYYFLLTLSHLLCLTAGWYSMYLDPSKVYFYVTFVLSVPLIRARHNFMLSEISKEKPTGEFDALRNGGTEDKRK